MQFLHQRQHQRIFLLYRQSLHDTHILSIGNVCSEYEYCCKDAKGWGILGWTIPMIHTVMNAAKQVTDYELKMLYHTMKQGENYIRIEKKLYDMQTIPAMDDASASALAVFLQIGNELVKEKENILDNLARELVENKRRPVGTQYR